MYKFSVWRTGKPEYLQKNLLQQRRQPTYHYGIDAGSWIRATSVTAKCFYNSIILASLHHPCSTAPSLLHPCSTAPSSLPCKILAPQLHPCSPTPSLLHCTILPLLLHPCSPRPSLPPFTVLLPCVPSTPCSPGQPCSEAIFKFKVYGSSVILHNSE